MLELVAPARDAEKGGEEVIICSTEREVVGGIRLRKSWMWEG